MEKRNPEGPLWHGVEYVCLHMHMHMDVHVYNILNI